MTQPFGPDGVGLRYAGMLDCLRKSLRAEGLRFGFKGFWPNYLSKGPTVVILFLLYEQARLWGDWWLDKDKELPPTPCPRGREGLSPESTIGDLKDSKRCRP